MASLTMRAADWGFLLSEAEGQRSRENGTIASGQGVVAAGTVMEGAATAMTVWDGTGAITGITGPWKDATSAAKPVAYVARDCEVNLKALVYPGAPTPSAPQRAAVIAACLAAGIIVRD